jgi:separase
MDCSSGNQYTVGEFESYGKILEYILAGCPSVVGNLWDVTGEIFDLTQDLLKSWLKLEIVDITNITDNDDSSNICMHIIKARNACKLFFHLNGSAPVIYGMPTSFE